MAAGLPMIVTDVGGNKEAVLHNETGIVISPNNPQEIAEALFALIDINKRLEFGIAGKNRIQENFYLERCINEYNKIYNELLKQPRCNMQKEQFNTYL